MGVDVYVLDFLAGVSRASRPFGDTLWLGRQGFHIGPEQKPDAEAVLQRHGSHLSFDDIAGKTHFCEALFTALGSSRISAMDISAFEGADVVHDLNTPVHAEYYNKYDTIFDGGTLEHVFNLPVALENVRKMLRVGGLFISVNAANNQLGHGFYQFSPELFWSYFRATAEFEVEQISLMPLAGMPNAIPAPDPATTGRREEIGSTPFPTYLFVAARKTASRHAASSTPQQSDYAATWKAHGESKAQPSGCVTAQLPSPMPGTHPESNIPRLNMVSKRRIVIETVRKMHLHAKSAMQSAPNMYPMTSALARRVNKPAAWFSQTVESWQTAFDASLMENAKPPRGDEIPAIRHRIWLTDPANPSFPKEQFLSSAAEQIRSENGEWHNVFWTNADDVEYYVKGFFASKGLTVQIARADAFAQHIVYPKLVALIDDKRFVLAADLLRMLVVNRMGGLYTDLGIRVSADIRAAILSSRYTLILAENGFFQSSLFASGPRSDLTELMLAVAAVPEAMPRDIVRMSQHITAMDEVNIFAGPMLTALALLFLADDERVFVVTGWDGLVDWESTASWYGDETKFGNGVILNSDPLFVSEEAYRTRDDLAKENFFASRGNTALGLKIEILMSLYPYFIANPTRTCEILYYQESDKALAWHNYSYFYHFILRKYKNQLAKLLEVGIGTNFEDTPSSMGATGVPGASLRGWREFLVDGHVYGADVDRRILFTSRSIDTFYVDQRDAGAIVQMWDQIGQPLEIVIDDGLHEYNANLNFFENSKAHVKPGGIFVLEDVAYHEIPLWRDYLTKSEREGYIIKIPNNANDRDNCLIFFPF